MISIKNNVCIKEYTTIKIGGLVKYFIEVSSIDDVKDAMIFIKNNKLKYYVLGNGSNVLISDEYYDGCVIRINNKFSDIKFGKDSVEVDAGCLLSTFINKCKDQSLSCIEELYGIPGTIGGSVYGNAGVKDFSISSRVISVLVLEDGIIKQYSNVECLFGYRDSVFKRKNCIVLRVKLRTKKHTKYGINYKIVKALRYRREHQPISSFSCGCVFKNVNNISSWKYVKEVEKCLKSYDFVRVSDKHASFIVNDGNATFKDVYNLIESIKNSVYYIYNIKLCEEVIVIDGR